FSIAAINDSDAGKEWLQPLAPTKEAQAGLCEFHLSQLYHDGLTRLQAGDYEKAREYLELVLKDPLISNVEVEHSAASDGHLLQLRFLALKNLASVFLQLSPSYQQNALHCYLQAVEIDGNDSVVWNQLGTLACSMGSLSTARWAFEQGLICSPSNWNCMEKLLEVLIAIGDEVACLSVSELILNHWPSHSRAMHVKSTIQDTEIAMFSPRGIDRLEPKHIRLKFPDKRKASDEDLDEASASKRLKQIIEIQLPEASWMALVSEMLEILRPLSVSGLASGDDKHISGNARLIVKLPPVAVTATECDDTGLAGAPTASNFNCSDCNPVNEKEGILNEEQPQAAQERRSTRLERLRSRKSEKEETLGSNKDLAEIVKKFLLPYIVDQSEAVNSEQTSNIAEEMLYSSSTESSDVMDFVRIASENFGLQHFGELLIEKIATICIPYHNCMTKLLELEKLSRNWARKRTMECSLFLAELYYDVGLRSFEGSAVENFMSEASYHLCKVIECVALDCPFHIVGMEVKSAGSQIDVCDQHRPLETESSFLLRGDRKFWIRFFWLSSHLSRLEGNEEKVHKELSVVLSLFTDKDKMNCHPGSISLKHCKGIKNLSADRVLYEMNLLEIDHVLKTYVREMFEKNLHAECISILAPLLLTPKVFYVDLCRNGVDEGKGVQLVELSSLDILIKSCEQSTPLDIDMYLNSHKRKLQVLLGGARIGVGSDDTLGLDIFSTHPNQLDEKVWKYWSPLVFEEVKAISQSASNIKSLISSDETSVSIHFEWSICKMIFSNKLTSVVDIGGIQSLLVMLMCSMANCFLAKRTFFSGVRESAEETEQGYFVDAAVAFCKLQHLNCSFPIKIQAELLVSVHDMLAEFGICCQRGSCGKDQEGAFLKFAIKHLLSLDMKLKSGMSSLNKERDVNLNYSNDDQLKVPEQTYCRNSVSGPQNESQVDLLDVKVKSLHTYSGGSSEKVSWSMEEENRGCFDNGGDRSDGLCTVTGTESIQREVMTEAEREELELFIDSALNQCFYCLYGLNLRSDSSAEDDLVKHKSTSQGDYQTKEQCADVFQYILPYAKASSRSGLIKLRKILRTIRKHFPQPPDSILSKNTIDKFLDDPDLCEDKLFDHAGSTSFLDSMPSVSNERYDHITDFLINLWNLIFTDSYTEVYRHLYFLLAQSEEMRATDKWAGFVLTKEGEEFVEQNANLFKYDLLYNPLRFESWQRLANIYDEEVDLLLNDGSKQINVLGWSKSSSLPRRVEASRRRSRRCLLVTLALAKAVTQQAEIHELLALVYYDGVQNVVPFYDQRLALPLKNATWTMFCENAMSHFKTAFQHRKDWSHAFYIGKLCEKLGFLHDVPFSHYAQAIDLNPTAVDAFYRMHASRLKLLSKCGKQNEEALKVVATHSFAQSTKETVTNIFGGLLCESSDSAMHHPEEANLGKYEDIWAMLYEDCLSALETCVEGDLKHFHKARYMISQGLYRRGGTGDIERAKEELSFCFKSARSTFTINMWEIDSTVKKGRRKNAGPSGNRRCLEVNLAESSRKFITCIRKYLLFYLKLLEETGDVSLLERAYVFLRVDKRFSLCLEDLVPVALARYIKALIVGINHATSDGVESGEPFLEKLFNLFLEQVSLWSEVCNLPELNEPDFSEDTLFGFLCRYIQLLERNVRVETLEAINEKIRKRMKNPKLSNSNCARVYRHVSAAWCRSLVVGMALVTPLHRGRTTTTKTSTLEASEQHLLCVDLQSEELWCSPFEDRNHLKSVEAGWGPSLSKIKNVIVKRASDDDLETAALLLRSSYSFYRDTSCALLPSGINLYTAPSQLSAETYVQPGIDGFDIIDMNTSRKLLLWAYSLVHGCYTNVAHVIRFCEDAAK
ncbi:hypothetical protein M569_06550, partial [Genlisea aurea]